MGPTEFDSPICPLLSVAARAKEGDRWELCVGRNCMWGATYPDGNVKCALGTIAEMLEQGLVRR